jgi:hypothetical protein
MHLHAAPRFRKSGAVTLLSLYAFTARIIKLYFSSHLLLGLPSDIFCSYHIWDFHGGNYGRTSWQKFSVLFLTFYMNFTEVGHDSVVTSTSSPPTPPTLLPSSSTRRYTITVADSRSVNEMFSLVVCYTGRFVVTYRRFGKTYRNDFEGSSSPSRFFSLTSSPLKTGPIVCAENLVTIYRSTLRLHPTRAKTFKSQIKRCFFGLKRRYCPRLKVSTPNVKKHIPPKL